MNLLALLKGQRGINGESFEIINKIFKALKK